MPEPKPCSRCHVRPASTPRNAYCMPCRAAYQREWRRRQRGETAIYEELSSDPKPRERLRGTPTRSELVLYRLL